MPIMAQCSVAGILHPLHVLHNGQRLYIVVFVLKELMNGFLMESIPDMSTATSRGAV